MGRKRRSTPSSPDASARRQWIATALAFLLGLGAAFVFLARSQSPSTSPPPPPPPSPGAVQAHLDRARKHMEAQEVTDAQGELLKAQALAPQDPEVPFLLGDLAYQGLQMEAAEGHYRRAAELDPRSSAAFANLALVLLELGQARQAAEAARQAVLLDPREPRMQALLGQSLLRLDQPKEAADLLEQALGKGVRGAQSNAALGRARDLLGQTDAALKAFEEALRQDPRLPLAHYWRAECLRKAGRRAEAERGLRAYRQSQDLFGRLVRAELRVRQDPKDVPALLELARLRVERGVASQAVLPVLKAEQLAPADPEVLRVRDLVRHAAATTRDVES